MWWRSPGPCNRARAVEAAVRSLALTEAQGPARRWLREPELILGKEVGAWLGPVRLG